VKPPSGETIVRGLGAARVARRRDHSSARNTTFPMRACQESGIENRRLGIPLRLRRQPCSRTRRRRLLADDHPNTARSYGDLAANLNAPDRGAIGRRRARQRSQGPPVGRGSRRDPLPAGTTTIRTNHRISGPRSCWPATRIDRDFSLITRQFASSPSREKPEPISERATDRHGIDAVDHPHRLLSCVRPLVLDRRLNDFIKST
jgi:hypothetical protein